MQYSNLGRTGLKISKLCLGTMNFGVDTSKEEAFRIMDAALDAGINFFDTADIYGWGKNAGTTEKIIGEWFAQGGNRRNRVVLATKVHENICDPYEGINNEPGLSLYKIRRHFRGSLKRLQTDHIEIYYMHHVDRSVSWDELWNAFIPEVENGNVDYIASSNFAGWDLAVAQAAAKNHNFLGVVCEQHKYNLNCRLPELEVIPSAKYHKIGIIPWSPLDGGFLSRNALLRPKSGRSSKLGDIISAKYDQLMEFEKFCKGIGYYQDQVALAWLLANPVVNAPVIGPRTLDQFYEALTALEIKIGDSENKALDKIFPGPGGSAPEAYAW